MKRVLRRVLGGILVGLPFLAIGLTIIWTDDGVKGGLMFLISMGIAGLLGGVVYLGLYLLEG